MTGGSPDYGGGRALPVHASLEDPDEDLDGRLLIRLHVALLGMREGQIIRIGSPVAGLAEQLRAFEAATDHAILSVRPDPARPGWQSIYLRKGRARTDWMPADVRPDPTLAAAMPDLMPRRLWLYTNYDCNLACDYCCVVAGPRADPRRLDVARIHELVDEACDLGFERVFLTGGEPTLRTDLASLIEYITDRLPLTLLTNAMLLRGARWDRLRPLVTAGRPVTFQVSLDSAGPALHDAHRGAGAHSRALSGIRTLLAAGAHVRLAASLPEAHLDEIPGLHGLADELAIAMTDRIIRPIALRGAADGGEPIRPEDIAPELTCDAQGWFWHPLSNDPDMRLGLPATASTVAALAVVRERLTAMTAAEADRMERFTCG